MVFARQIVVQTLVVLKVLDFELEPIGGYLSGVLELAAAFLILFPLSMIAGAILALGLMDGAVIAHLIRQSVTVPYGLLFTAAVLTLVSVPLLVFLNRFKAGFLGKMFPKKP